MLFKSKIKYNGTKAYFLVTDAVSINLNDLIDTFLQYSDFEVTQFPINYSELKDVELFSKEKENLSAEYLEHISKIYYGGPNPFGEDK